MPEKNWTDTYYYDFKKGIVSNYDAMSIPDNALVDINNMFPRRLGSLKKRFGYSMLGSEIEASNNGVMGIHSYYQEGMHLLMAVVDTDLYYWDDPNWASAISSLTANKKTEFANAMGSCIFVNGEDIPKKLTGLTVVDLGTGTDPDDWRPNKANLVEWRHNALWFGNITENDTPSYSKENSRVRQSEIRAIEGDKAYPWTYYYDFDSDTDEYGILGIHPYRDNLVIMKQRKTAMIVGTSRLDYGIFTYDGSMGSVSHRSMQEYDGKLFFLGTKGLYTFDGTYNIKYSDAIDDLMESLDKKQLYEGASVIWDNKYFLAVTKDAEDYNDTIIVFDSELESFTKLTGIRASCFTTFLSSPSRRLQLFFGESNAGKVYKLFGEEGGVYSYTDNGVAISASFETKKYFTGDPNWINDVRHLWVEAKGDSADTLTVKYRFDQNEDYSDGWTFNLSNRFQRFVFPEGSYGRLIQFKVENSSKLEPFEFFGFTLSQRPRREFS